MRGAARNALAVLRSTDQADWTIIPLIFFACYVYAVEVQVYCVLPGYLIIFFIITGCYDLLSVRLNLRQKALAVLWLLMANAVIYAVLAKWLEWT